MFLVTKPRHALVRWWCCVVFFLKELLRLLFTVDDFVAECTRVYYASKQ